MNRKELVEAVAQQAGLAGAQADAAVGAVVDCVIAAVAKGEKVTVPGFGTFETRHRAARKGRNPQTGDVIDIDASDAPAFKPATAFKQAVSG
jgi:DNA-binding protein HU-beta